MKCSKCGKEIKPGDKFCMGCGSPVSEVQSQGLGIASLVLGIVSIFIGIAFFPITIVGLVLGICQKGKSGYKIAGIIINSIMLFITLVVWIFFIIFLVNVKDYVVNEGGLEDIIDRIKENVEMDIEYNDGTETTDNWNLFADKRKGITLGKETTITGTWRELADEESYATFKDGVLYYSETPDGEKQKMGVYKRVDKEKYMKEIKKIISMTSDLVSEDDFIVTDITLQDNDEEETNVFIWLIVNHDEEGIELRYTDVDVLETTSYVKIAD